MALHSHTEFAKLCGLERGAISVYRSRRKIVYTYIDEVVFIDDSIRENKDFLQKRLDVLASQPPKIEEIAPKEPTVKPQKPVKEKVITPKKVEKPIVVISKSAKVDNDQRIEEKKKVQERENAENDSKYLVDLEQARANLEKKEIDIRIALLNESKLRGENIPASEIKSLLSELSHNFINNYKDFSNTLLTDIFHKYKISLVDQSKIKSDFVKGLNQTHDRVFNNVAKKIENTKKNK